MHRLSMAYGTCRYLVVTHLNTGQIHRGLTSVIFHEFIVSPFSDMDEHSRNQIQKVLRRLGD